MIQNGLGVDMKFCKKANFTKLSAFTLSQALVFPINATKNVANIGSLFRVLQLLF
jgi:hypothetical protein